MEGIVFDIARCSLHDGPGLRTTVFLKGCPLDCPWCHNPESKKFPPQKVRAPRGGGEKLYGTTQSLGEVMKTVLKDRAYYETSGGGLTISGGEPMGQFDFTKALAEEAVRRGISVVLETSGAAPREHYKALLPWIDLFLLDYKGSDPEQVKALCRADAGQIEGNFRFLYEKGARIIRRCLLIPGINDTQEHAAAVCSMSLDYPRLVRTEILLYHDLWRGKAREIGSLHAGFSAPSLDNAEGAARVARLFRPYPKRKIFLKSELLP